MIRYRKVAAMVDMAQIFRNRFWSNKADNHYLLLATAAAVAGQTTTYQGAAADGQLRRDILTINEAAFQLANRCKDKGYGDTASLPLVLYANPKDKGRILAAFAATTGQMTNVAGGAVAIHWNITRSSRSREYRGRPPDPGAPRRQDPGRRGHAPTTFTAPKTR
jgi:hypothetical protein